MGGVETLDALPEDRLEGWEQRLLAEIGRAGSEPYVLGVNDCFRLACGVVQALVGVNRWPLFVGTYKTRREALVRLSAWGSTFTAAGSAFFGGDPVDARLARRGDILEFRDATGEAHLVVCMGRHAVGLLERGVVAVPLRDCAHAWRVG